MPTPSGAGSINSAGSQAITNKPPPKAEGITEAEPLNNKNSSVSREAEKGIGSKVRRAKASGVLTGEESPAQSRRKGGAESPYHVRSKSKKTEVEKLEDAINVGDW